VRRPRLPLSIRRHHWRLEIGNAQVLDTVGFLSVQLWHGSGLIKHCPVQPPFSSGPRGVHVISKVVLGMPKAAASNPLMGFLQPPSVENQLRS